jgi:outer membrane protein OmpA-like peptidoglycan-associated protein
MRTNLILTAAVGLSLVGTGCATKKYVAKTMAPVEARVATAETKNADQDKMLSDQGKEIDDLQTRLSRANERISDVDTKVTAAGQSAERAGSAASVAQRTADQANTAAGNALTAANSGRDQAIAHADQVGTELSSKVDKTVKFSKATEETVLFATNQATLSKDAKAALDTFATQLSGKDRYIVEIQGFTDKTGSPDVNYELSQRRAEAVTRYLVNEHHVPLHMVTTLGSGWSSPAGDDKTRAGRKQNRRVEVRLFAPEVASLAQAK